LAYRAVRSLKGLPLSLPSTTMVLTYQTFEYRSGIEPTRHEDL